jgi:maleylacetoacetate isomerase
MQVKGLTAEILERSELDIHEPVPILYDNNGLRLTQSMVILEYLDQKHPDSPRLYPTDPIDNVRVKELVQIIVSDIQPLQTQVLLSRLNALNHDPKSNEKLIRSYLERGLQRYDRLMDQNSDYSVGGLITAADIALYPQCQNANGYEIKISDYPNIYRVVSNLKKFFEN